ncbi:hypothetical protein D9613_009663 [Agrocybe pediades]|uniref:Fido domain-containing protein n=1 Tax=Agrocybe pediades TaxID=84607 RepID=A0A8H4QXC2_9AGAR|nr:hypothetical protein D9613_009663 [Agrocybe pediades]
MSFETPLLNEIPDVVSASDRARLKDVNALSPMECVKLLQEMIDTYSDSHPYFLVQLAHSLIQVGSGMISVDFYRKAQHILAGMNIVDSELDRKILKYYNIYERSTRDALTSSEKSTFTQDWKCTREHKFPVTFPILPADAKYIKEQWATRDDPGSTLGSAYMNKLAVDTSQVESVFHLTDESALDIIKNGISAGKIDTLPDSALRDSGTIKEMMKDTLAAYDLLLPIVADPEKLTPTAICNIHARVMNTCRYIGKHYTPPGRTRTETQKTVVIMGAYTVRCCPFPEVDKELEYICRMAKQWIRTWRNPFATASWIHLIIANCHPFDDGNGRVARLIASIPLIRNGYPPISLNLHQTPDYYNSLRMVSLALPIFSSALLDKFTVVISCMRIITSAQARDGDHANLINCVVEGIKETLQYAKEPIGEPEVDTKAASAAARQKDKDVIAQVAAAAEKK